MTNHGLQNRFIVAAWLLLAPAVSARGDAAAACEAITVGNCRVVVRFRGSRPFDDRFDVRCNVALGSASDGIDPIAEGIRVGLTDADSPQCSAPCFAAAVTPRRIGRCWRYTAATTTAHGLKSVKLCDVDPGRGLYRLSARGRDSLQCLNTAPPYSVGLTVGNDCAPDCGATATSTTTVPTSTSSTSVPVCCGAERLRLVGGPGTVKIAGFAPFPLPAGAVATLDAGPAASNCHHDVVVPAGGLTLPTYCLTGFAFAMSTYSTGCAAGDGDGAGVLWDGHAAQQGGVPDTNVLTSADSSDGTCDATGGTCGDRRRNTFGNIDITRAAGGRGDEAGFRFDVPAHTIAWVDSEGTFEPEGCTGDGVYNPADGDYLAFEWDSTLSLTTGNASAQFADQNQDGCDLPVGSAGFGAPSAECAAGPKGPCSVTGSEMAGPCCTVGQSASIAMAGVAFSNSFPVYDLGFLASLPVTVASCDPWVGSSCTALTADACRE